MTSPPRWRLYEQLAHRIVDELLPFADVRIDDHIQGGESGIARQIDVSARWRDPDDAYRLLIVQVKDYKGRADVNVVGAFRSVLLDVRADRGVLVCSEGFSKNAKRYAANLGISLYTLHDAQSVFWNKELTVAVVRARLALVDSSMSFGSTVRLEAGQLDLNHTTTDFGATEQSLLTVIASMWNRGQLPSAAGAHVVRMDRAIRAKFRPASGGPEQWISLGDDFEIQYETAVTYALRHIIPAESRGILDALDNENYWPTWISITENQMNDAEAADVSPWEPISDPERLAVVSRGTVLNLVQVSQLDGARAAFGDGRALRLSD